MIWYFLLLSLVGRLGLLVYGYWQDTTMVVKYTDVDYTVFTDAARLMYQGHSPYNRPTYRYTPLLAWMLQPNVWMGDMFGKVLFVVFDVMTGYIIYKTLKQQRISEGTCLSCACGWLMNPLAATVSTRGNAESIMTCLIVLTIMLMQKEKIVWAAITYGFSVHFKIYPITYALPIYFYLNDSLAQGIKTKTGIGYLWAWIGPTKKQLLFIVVALSVTLFLTGIFYLWYGQDFLQHTYLYHISRKDVRHNFSPYFYLLYLTDQSTESSSLALFLFVPQVVLLLVFSIRFYHDLPMCFFLQTYIFVAFNKVCTSQYFLWYLCLLPLLMPHLQILPTKAVVMAALWLLGQGVWLYPAFLLEFEGLNTFLYIWLAGCIFLMINVYIITTIMSSYRFHHQNKIKAS